MSACYLRSILATQDEVWGIMNENSRLIEQFGQLATGMAPPTANGGSSTGNKEIKL